MQSVGHKGPTSFGFILPLASEVGNLAHGHDSGVQACLQ